MEKTITIHVGAPKTGTTSIQLFLFQNAGVLQQQGVIYPTGEFDQIYAGHAHHFALVEALCGNVSHKFSIDRAEVQAAVLKSTKAALANRDVKHIIFSHEMLYGGSDLVDFDCLRAIVGDARVRIVIYARQLDQWCESLYRQFVWGRVLPGSPDREGKKLGPVENFYHSRNIDKRTVSFVADLYKSALPDAEIIVRPFSIHRETSLLSDFLTTVGVNSDTLIEEQSSAEHMNASKPKSLLFLLWHLQQTDLPLRKCYEISQAAFALIEEGHTIPEFEGREFRFLPVETARRAFDLYQKDIERFDSLSRDAGRSFAASEAAERMLQPEDIDQLLAWLSQKLPDDLMVEARSALGA